MAVKEGLVVVNNGLAHEIAFITSGNGVVSRKTLSVAVGAVTAATAATAAALYCVTKDETTKQTMCECDRGANRYARPDLMPKSSHCPRFSLCSHLISEICQAW